MAGYILSEVQLVNQTAAKYLILSSIVMKFEMNPYKNRRNLILNHAAWNLNWFSLDLAPQITSRWNFNEMMVKWGTVSKEW